MASISNRFENPRGRSVQRVKAAINFWGPSCGARQPVPAGEVSGQRMTEFVISLGLEDGRSIQVALSKKDIELINRASAEYASKLPWAEPA